MATLIYDDTSIYPKRRNTRTSSARIKLRAYTAAKWQETNFKLAENELAYDKTNRQLKIGDGVTHWNELPFLNINLSGNIAGVASIEELNAIATLLNSSNALHDGRLDVLEGRDLSLTALINALGLRVETLETEGVGGGNVDLSDYATLAQLEAVQGSVSGIAQSNNGQQSQINDLINRTTALENEPAPTVDLSGYVTAAAFNSLSATVDDLIIQVNAIQSSGGSGSGGGTTIEFPSLGIDYPANNSTDLILPIGATKTYKYIVPAGRKTNYVSCAQNQNNLVYLWDLNKLKWEILDLQGNAFLVIDAPTSANQMFYANLQLIAGEYLVRFKNYDSQAKTIATRMSTVAA